MSFARMLLMTVCVFLVAVSPPHLVVRCDAVADSYPFRCDATPEQHAEMSKKALGRLEAGGFSVETGKLVYAHSSEFGANPSTLYGTFRFGVIPFFTMSESDAIIFVSCTPPPMRYFSITPYVLNTPELNKSIVFASLQDPLNSLFIRTASSSSLAPFSSTTLVVMTASVDTDSAVRAAFSTDLPSNHMNTLRVSNQLAKLGSGPLAASGLGALVRVAIYENTSECDAYTNTSFPVYRLSRTRTQDKLFGLPALRPRRSGSSEEHLEATLDKLMKAVLANISQSGYIVAYKGRMSAYPLDARECIAKGTNCLGDCPDAAYFADLTEFDLGVAESRDIFMVVGVDHRRVGMATYTNFALDTHVAVTDDKFPGSAAQYLPSDEGISNYFAYKVARTCSEQDLYCLAVSTEVSCPCVNTSQPGRPLALTLTSLSACLLALSMNITNITNVIDVPTLLQLKAGEKFRFVGRVYLNPKTSTGPAYNETITNYVLHFTPKQNA